MADNAPSYHQVASQLAANNGGWLGRFGNFFGGGSTPAYIGEGQPSTVSLGGFLGGGTPAYRLAPVVNAEVTPTRSPATEQRAPIEQSTTEHPDMAQAECPVDPDPFGSGPIAIIISRQG